ncbi:MAG: hypothetical protein JW700_02445 [Candidatus Aenigmarchaeota archaeon]|nr:hypothetical protein [Candidatus Aenigmarchaeota archaeon]
MVDIKTKSLYDVKLSSGFTYNKLELPFSFGCQDFAQMPYFIKEALRADEIGLETAGQSHDIYVKKGSNITARLRMCNNNGKGEILVKKDFRNLGNFMSEKNKKILQAMFNYSTIDHKLTEYLEERGIDEEKNKITQLAF